MYDMLKNGEYDNAGALASELKLPYPRIWEAVSGAVAVLITQGKYEDAAKLAGEYGLEKEMADAAGMAVAELIKDGKLDAARLVSQRYGLAVVKGILGDN